MAKKWVITEMTDFFANEFDPKAFSASLHTLLALLSAMKASAFRG